MRLPCSALIQIALAICSVRIAAADGAGVIAVSVTDRAATGSAMADAMAGRARRVIADAVVEARTMAANGAVPVDTLARFRRVKTLVDEGWNAYLRVAADVAASRLATARTEAEHLVALPGGAEVYADAALRLGIVLGYLQRKPEADAVFALALALDPDRPITKAEFAPDVVDAIEAVRARPPVLEKLHVESSPAGALIRIDGRDVGRAPVDVDVARGQHLVIAQLPQAQPAVQGVAVDGPAKIELRLEQDPELERLIGGAVGAATEQELVDAALRYADLDEIVIVNETVRRGGPVLLAQRCVGSGAPAKCSAVVEIGFAPGGLAAAARSAWEAVRVGELRYPPSVLGERATRGGTGRCKLCRSPILWGGVGAAVVAGVIIVIATSGSKPAPVVGVDPMQYLPR
jgi:hypothetical protein